MTDTISTAQAVRNSIGLLTEEDAAAVLLLHSVGTLATWRSQKTGPRPVKLGKKVFYTASSLVTWINAKVTEQDNEFYAPHAVAREKVAA